MRKANGVWGNDPYCLCVKQIVVETTNHMLTMEMILKVPEIAKAHQSSFNLLRSLEAQRRTRRFSVKPTKTPATKKTAHSFEQVHKETTCLGGKATKTPEVSEEDRAAEETPLPLRL